MDSLLIFPREEAETLLVKETRVLERLQGERIKLFKEMEMVSLKSFRSRA
jgi:hypothetical protein